MINIIRTFPNQWEGKIANGYVLIFIASILFTFFFKKGIEFSRYALIIFTICMIYTNREIPKQIVKSPSFLVLSSFIFVAMASLIYNNSKLSNIDEVINWTICYISGYFAFQIMQNKTKFILYIIPVALFLTQIVYPFAIMDQIAIDNIFSSNRLDLFFEGKPIHLGFFCGISTFTAAAISYYSDKRLIKILFSALSLVSFCLLVSTGTRTTFVGTMITFAVALYLLFRKNKTILRFAATSILFITPILLLVFNANGLRIASIISLESVNDSYLQRELIFKIGKESFFRSPILGEGFDRFSDIYKKNIEILSHDDHLDKKYSYILKSSNNAHNFSLHFLAETGILGFICMNVLWMYIIISGFKSSSEISQVIAGIFLLSYIALQFNMSLYGGQISTLLFSLAGISGAATQGLRSEKLSAIAHHSFPSTHKAEQ